MYSYLPTNVHFRHTKLVCLTASFLATGGFKPYLFQNACIAYKHAYLNTLLFLHSTFMLCMVKMLLKGVVGGRTLKGNYMNHGIVFLDFYGNPDLGKQNMASPYIYK